MADNVKDIFLNELEEIEQSGLYKDERLIKSPQGAQIKVDSGEVLNWTNTEIL